MTLNVQHTVKGKEAGLRGLISQLHFPDVLFLQEVGKLHPDHALHPLYQSWIIPGHGAQMGVAIMLKKDPTLVVHAQDFMVNYRSLVLCVTYLGTKYLLANVYLHADGDVAGNQEVLDWLLPHITTTYDALVIVVGGAACQCRLGPWPQRGFGTCV